MLLELVSKIGDITINIFLVRGLIIIAMLELLQGYYSYFYCKKNNKDSIIEQSQVRSFFFSSFILTGLLLFYFLYKIKTL